MVSHRELSVVTEAFQRMLAPDNGSTNTDPPTTSDKSPLVTQRLYRRISGIFSAHHNPRNNSQGYVEFGSISEASETRTLGTFAGVFSPVTLSMFSALVFLRVGKNFNFLMIVTQFLSNNINLYA